MSKCEYPDCEQKGEERVYRGHDFLLCEIHFAELKEDERAAKGLLEAYEGADNGEEGERMSWYFLVSMLETFGLRQTISILNTVWPEEGE